MILAIDIGSNTIKCLLASSNGGSIESIYEKSLDRRILASGNELVADASTIIADSILLFEREASAFVDKFETIVVATSALRDFPRKDDILKSVFEKTSREIKILSGEKEASLSFRGAMSDSSIDSLGRCVYFDLGGGSLEVVAGENGYADSFVSVPVGAVRLTRGEGDYSAISKDAISASLSSFPQSDKLIGAGGAVVAARLMKKKLGIDGAENEIYFDEMERFLEIVTTLTSRELVEKFSISANRADILPAAFACIVELMRFFKVDKITHTFHNLRYGVVISGGAF